MQRDFRMIALPALKQVREEKQLSQAEMASILSEVLNRTVSVAGYSRWETADRTVVLSIAVRICRVLQAPLGKLFRPADGESRIKIAAKV